MADAPDSKSGGGDTMSVRLPPPAYQGNQAKHAYGPLFAGLSRRRPSPHCRVMPSHAPCRHSLSEGEKVHHKYITNVWQTPSLVCVRVENNHGTTIREQEDPQTPLVNAPTVTRRTTPRSRLRCEWTPEAGSCRMPVGAGRTGRWQANRLRR